MPTISAMTKTVSTTIFTSFYHHSSSQFSPNSSSSPLNGEANEVQEQCKGKNNNIESIVLPKISIFYGLRTVSTIIFSNSNAGTISCNSSHAHGAISVYQPHANSSSPLNVKASELQEQWKGKNNNIESIMLSKTSIFYSLRTVSTIIFSSSDSGTISSNSSYAHGAISLHQSHANSSSPLNAEASELQEQWKGKNNNIGSIVLPGTSIFYCLRTVSTIIFSTSDSGTNSSGSSHAHKEISHHQPNANSPAPLNVQATDEVKEYTVLSNQPKWKRGKLLGQGGFGRVYKGFNSETGQICAIKEVLVDADDERSEKCLQQLFQEKNILSQLSHPNIVKYYGSESGKEGISIYMEYASCGSIHHLIKKYGPLEEHYIQHYTKQIVSALFYLHRRNIVHRDIKGANILVYPNDQVKLADFGLARYVNNCYSLMYSFKGSLYWMAPEMVNNKSGYTIAVDIWSLGCTVLEMAAKNPPWSEYKYKREVLMAKIANNTDLPVIPDHLSDTAKFFIRFCLQKDPMARPPAEQLLYHPFVQDGIFCNFSL